MYTPFFNTIWLNFSIMNKILVRQITLMMVHIVMILHPLLLKIREVSKPDWLL